MRRKAGHSATGKCCLIQEKWKNFFDTFWFLIFFYSVTAYFSHGHVSFQIAIMTVYYTSMARGGPQAPARLNANVMMVKSAVHLSSVQNSAVIIRSKNAGNAALNVPRKKVRYLKRTSEDFSNIPKDYRLFLGMLIRGLRRSMNVTEDVQSSSEVFRTFPKMTENCPMRSLHSSEIDEHFQ